MSNTLLGGGFVIGKLYKILKVLLIIINVANLVTLIKFIKLHILFYPDMHDLMRDEIIIVVFTIVFIIISIYVYKHPLNLNTYESKADE